MLQNKVTDSYVTGKFPSKLQSSNAQFHHNNSNIRQTQFSFGNGRMSGRQEQFTFGDHITLRDSNFPLPSIHTQNRTTISQRETYQVMPQQRATLVRSNPYDRSSPNSSSTIGVSYHNNLNEKNPYTYNSNDNMGKQQVKNGCFCCKD